MKTYCKPFRRGVSWRSQEFAAHPNNGTNGPGGHTGNDEAAVTGTPVHAAGDGVVIYAGTFDGTYADNLLWLLNFGGNILVLDCGDDEPTFVYAHLHGFRVKRGDRVRLGQVIADSGNSGTRTTGSHLHMEAIPPGFTLHSPTLGRVDPDRYCTVWPEDLPTITHQGTTITKEFDDVITDADVKRIAQATADIIFPLIATQNEQYHLATRTAIIEQVEQVDQETADILYPVISTQNDQYHEATRAAVIERLK